jgi:hypothetical protein
MARIKSSMYVGPWTHPSVATRQSMIEALKDGRRVYVHIDGEYRELAWDETRQELVTKSEAANEHRRRHSGPMPPGG